MNELIKLTRITRHVLIAWAFVLYSPASTQEVGIGTTVPTARLDVIAPTTYASPLLRVQHGTSPYLVVSHTGRVGIGTNTPIARLHIAYDGMIYATGGIGAGDTVPPGSKIAFIWNPRKGAIRAGGVNGNLWDFQNIGDFSTAFGAENMASGNHSVVSGGGFNHATADYSTIGGGLANRALFGYAVVGGGINDTASGYASTVAGGSGNHASFSYATVGGGSNNKATAYGSTVGGGDSNKAEGYGSTVGGGVGNLAIGTQSFIGGGARNKVSSYAGVIVGGLDNQSLGHRSIVVGGDSNQATNYWSFIGGGRSNKAFGSHSIIVGGHANFIPAGTHSGIIVGGDSNALAPGASFAVIGGGYLNKAVGASSVISGGQFNYTTATYSTIAGGAFDTVLGYASTIGGGTRNKVAGIYAWAGGHGMKLGTLANNTFVWGHDASSNPPTINTPNAFLIGPNGTAYKVGINLPNPAYDLHLANNSAAKPGTNTWTVASDARLKARIQPYQEGLQTVLQIQPVWYEYNGKAGTPKGEKYVGVIAQELQKIAPYMVNEWKYVDPATGETTIYLGVDNGAMTYMIINAVKELANENQWLKQEVNRLRSVEARVAQLEALIKAQQ